MFMKSTACIYNFNGNVQQHTKATKFGDNQWSRKLACENLTWFLWTHMHLHVNLYSFSPYRGSRKLGTVFDTVSCMQQLRIEHMLSCARFVVTPAPSIKICAIASYYLFHSHAQVVSSC